jgi:hypothetical protein
MRTRARCTGHEVKGIKEQGYTHEMRTRSDLYITSLDGYPQCASHRGSGIEGLGEYSLAVKAVVCFCVNS